MKKQTKKGRLAFTTETMRVLATNDLGEVAGGGHPITTAITCTWPRSHRIACTTAAACGTTTF